MFAYIIPSAVVIVVLWWLFKPAMEAKQSQKRKRRYHLDEYEELTYFKKY